MKPYSIRFSATALALGAALISVLPLAAKTNDSFRVTIGAGHRFDADIDNHGGDFNEARAGISASHKMQLNDRWRLDPFLSYRFSAYDFSDREPWDNIHAARATVLAQYSINDQWAVFGGPTVGLAADDDADLDEAFTFGGTAGVIYRVNERLAVGVGAGVTSELEDDARFRPALIVKWRINDHWSLESGYFEVAGSGGPGVEIRYHINDRWSLAGGAQYHETRFRLEDGGTVGVISRFGPDRVGEDTSVPVYLKALWQAHANFGVEVGVGISLGGELRIDGEDGHKISEEDYDPAPFLGLRAVLTF